MFSDKFAADNKDILHDYAKEWAADPLHTWSRGWEYTYVAAAVRKYAPGKKDLLLLDVGSGVTFIDWMIAYEVLGDNIRSRVIALDSDADYYEWFNKINKRYMMKAKRKDQPEKYLIPKVAFIEHDIEQEIVPLVNSVDIVYCISVMEHVTNATAIVKNLYNILVSGGYLIITFDIDINGIVVNHRPEYADALLLELRRYGKEIYTHDSSLRVYNNDRFLDRVERQNGLYTLYEGRKNRWDQARWIEGKNESVQKGLFFSCHVFQKFQ